MAGINALHIYGVNGNQYNGYDEGGYGPDHPGQPEPAFFGYIIFLPECAYDQGYDEKDKEKKDGGDHVGRFWVMYCWLRVTSDELRVLCCGYGLGICKRDWMGLN
jgi:hypothetical protein